MTPPTSEHLTRQIVWLCVLAIPISCIAWTVTREEILREVRTYLHEVSRRTDSLLYRKLIYLVTCEYCFSHWVTLLFVWMTRYRLLLDDWRGYVISLFGLVWIANAYMSLYGRLRVDIRSEQAEASAKEKQAEVLQTKIQQEQRSNR